MRIPALLSLALAGIAACAPPTARDTPSEAPADAAPSSAPFIRDDQGRALIFHGMNVDSHAKSSPGRELDISPDEIAMMADDWGLNFVRMLVLWDQAEPTPGVYDEAYFDRIEARLDQFDANGMKVMLDMHQDLYAAKFTGDGAPDWAIRDDGLPFEAQTLSWALNYFQPAVKRSFDNFWAYTDGDHADLQDHYSALWAHLAERFQDHPAVIGYDLMNEPHPGSDFDLAEIVGREELGDGGTSRTFDEDKLGPFYQRVIHAIREVDSDSWLFVESRYGGPGNGGRSFLPVLDDPRPEDPRLVYTPHLYSFDLEAQGAYPSDDPTIPFWEARRTEELARQPMPMVLGEWGLAHDATDAARFDDEVLAMSDRMMAGWAYWSWDPGGTWPFWVRDGQAETPHLDRAVRTYPRAVAGDPLGFHLDPATGTFSLTFVDRDGVSGPTEIYVPSRHYPNGVDVRSTDLDGTWSFAWSQTRADVLEVTMTATGGQHALYVTRKP